MTIDNYFASNMDKTILIAGIGVSNLPLMRLLHGRGMKIAVWDGGSADTLGDTASELETLGVPAFLGGCLPDSHYDIVFRSPGLRPDAPVIEAQTANGAALTSEMELFMSLCPCKVIAVTGSDGKTTTSTLVSEMLKAEGYTVYLGGNIGTPLLTEVFNMKPDDFVVVELSSFQLMTMVFAPDAAVVTNVAPNHLDWHTNMEEYVDAKCRIYVNQRPEQKLVLNAGNDISCSFADAAPSKVMFFNREQSSLSAEDILLPGAHNIENFLAAEAAVSDYAGETAILKVRKTFRGVPHRIELVRELHGVRYYNDSIASSPTRAIAGLHSFPEPVILIAGGSDKKIPFDTLGKEICSHVKALYLTGDTAEKINNAVAAYPNHPTVIITETLAEAVKRAHDIAKQGDVILLSPACASFDRYKNFAHRGDVFKEIVGTL